jgi:hypothetical protein
MWRKKLQPKLLVGVNELGMYDAYILWISLDHLAYAHRSCTVSLLPAQKEAGAKC